MARPKSFGRSRGSCCPAVSDGFPTWLGCTVNHGSCPAQRPIHRTLGRPFACWMRAMLGVYWRHGASRLLRAVAWELLPCGFGCVPHMGCAVNHSSCPARRPIHRTLGRPFACLMRAMLGVYWRGGASGLLRAVAWELLPYGFGWVPHMGCS